MLKLRQKLERDPSHPLPLLTVHGVGAENMRQPDYCVAFSPSPSLHAKTRSMRVMVPLRTRDLLRPDRLRSDPGAKEAGQMTSCTLSIDGQPGVYPFSRN